MASPISYPKSSFLFHCILFFCMKMTIATLIPIDDMRYKNGNKIERNWYLNTLGAFSLHIFLFIL